MLSLILVLFKLGHNFSEYLSISGLSQICITLKPLSSASIIALEVPMKIN